MRGLLHACPVARWLTAAPLPRFLAEPSPLGGADPWLCHTKRTFNPSLIIRKRRHGFLSRWVGKRLLSACWLACAPLPNLGCLSAWAPERGWGRGHTGLLQAWWGIVVPSPWR